MKLLDQFLLALLVSGFAAFAADDPKPAADTKPSEAGTPSRPPAPQYKTDPDSLPQAGVPKGKLEGPFIFKSQVFSNTVRKYWVFVPAQYTAEKPACVLVFQDGQRATRTNGVLRVPQVMENLWHVQNEAMLAALKEKGCDVTHSFAEGTHSDAHGGSIMPEMLRWIWRDYRK